MPWAYRERSRLMPRSKTMRSGLSEPRFGCWMGKHIEGTVALFPGSASVMKSFFWQRKEAAIQSRDCDEGLLRSGRR